MFHSYTDNSNGYRAHNLTFGMLKFVSLDIQSNFFNANVYSVNSSLAQNKFKVFFKLLSTIILMECNLFRANFISAKSPLIQGEILVPTPNNSSSVCPISSNCRR